jgi:predicted enzyme related to lactoylglutathione lyase
MVQLEHITFSCDDPARVADFWGRLLDYEATAAGSSWVARDPHGKGTTLLFNRMPKTRTLQLPIHLDINVADRESEVARVFELGGKLVETKSIEIGDLRDTWTIMRDPEGNGFCLENGPESKPNHIWNVSFSAAEPRELGRFWAYALGWPDEEVDPAIVQRFRDAGVGEPELSGFHVTSPPNGGWPRFYFQRREKSRPESHPIHLDFGTDDRDAEIVRLTAAGASVVETKVGTNITFTIMRDPEGNPFCVG